MAERYIIHVIQYDDVFPNETIVCNKTLADAFQSAFDGIETKLNCCAHQFFLTADNVAKIQLDKAPRFHNESDEDEKTYAIQRATLSEVKHLPIDIEDTSTPDSIDDTYGYEISQFTELQKIGLSAVSTAEDLDESWCPYYAPYDVVIKKIEEGLKTIVLWTTYGDDGCCSTVCLLEVKQVTAKTTRHKIAIIPIGDEQIQYAQQVYRKLYDSIVFDNTYLSLDYRIKSAQDAGYKFILVVGAEESSTSTVLIRTNNNEVIGTKTIDEAVKYL